jgi:CubicO group peptidase (beta-lactamase class C family)
MFDARQLTRIDDRIADIMTDIGVTGLQVTIGTVDGQVFGRGYGLADLENSVPVTRDSVFRTASISKWFTATAAMRLVEEGSLELDAPVQRYCGQFPQKKWPVTVRHLLTHTAGIRYYHFGHTGGPPTTLTEFRALTEKGQDEYLRFLLRFTNVADTIEYFKDDPLLFEPGTQYQYTSQGYRLVGCVLEGAAGEPYNSLMQELVFAPAQMSRTIADDARAIVPHRVSGYRRDSSGQLQRSGFRDVSENLPAGGHLSNTDDLVRFGLAFLGEGLISEGSRREMIKRPDFPVYQSDVAQLSGGSTEEDRHYGLGISVSKWDDNLVLSHEGAQDETRTLLYVVPDKGLAVGVMTNFENMDSDTRRGVARLLISIYESSPE